MEIHARGLDTGPELSASLGESSMSTVHPTVSRPAKLGSGFRLVQGEEMSPTVPIAAGRSTRPVSIGIWIRSTTNPVGTGLNLPAYASNLAEEINRRTNHRAWVFNADDDACGSQRPKIGAEDHPRGATHPERARAGIQPDIWLAPVNDSAGCRNPHDRPPDGSSVYNPDELDAVAALVQRIGRISSAKNSYRQPWGVQKACARALKAFKDHFDPFQPRQWISAAKKTVKAAWRDPGRLIAWDIGSLILLGCFRQALGAPSPAPPAGGPARTVAHVRLLLPVAYKGGVWELVKNLVTELVSLNRAGRAMRLSFMVHKDQDISDLNFHENELPVLRLSWSKYAPTALVWDHGVDFQPDDQPAEHFFWPTGDGEKTGDEPDAIFTMVDRFVGRLAPLKPYGVWVYDMIQERAPQGFRSESVGWFEHYESIMKPNIRRASVVVVPSRCVGEDAQAAYQVPPDKLRTIPVACEPRERFGGMDARRIEGLEPPFFLYPANAAPHKGADVVVRAMATAKRLAPDFPLLVQCGVNTELFSTSSNDQQSQHVVAVRKLVSSLALTEGKDIRFLGTVSDQELKWLFENAIGVINAARFDNGSFSLIEGHWFGCQLISTDYPGIRELVERFGLPVHSVPLDDPDALAAKLSQVWQQWKSGRGRNPSMRVEIKAEHSTRTQAERFYLLLTQFGLDSMN